MGPGSLGQPVVWDAPKLLRWVFQSSNMQSSEKQTQKPGQPTMEEKPPDRKAGTGNGKSLLGTRQRGPGIA